MKTKKPIHKAEGGDITGARTMGEAQRYVPRERARSTPPAGEVNRRAQGAPQQHRKLDDSPATMAKNRAAAKKR
jgi:hypothetical protein